MKTTVIFVFSFILILFELYFYRAVSFLIKSKSKTTRRVIKLIYFLGSILFLTIALVIATNKGKKIPTPLENYLIGFVFIALISKIIGSIPILVSDALSLIVFLYRKLVPHNLSQGKYRRRFLKRMAIILAAVPFTSLLYGILKTAFDFTVFKETLKIKASHEGLGDVSIVQISDLHLGSFLSAAPVKKIVDKINSLSPDIIFFTGDLVNNISEEALPFVSVLKQIKSKYGVYSILGNHDYGDYHYKTDDKAGKLHNRVLMKEIHRDLNWDLLLNEHRILEINNHKIAIIGVENWGDRGRFPKLGNIEKAKKGIPQEMLKLLLSHDPSHYKTKIEGKHKDIAVTFSGHTHGMQFGIEIPGFIKWSPSKYLYKYWAGLYTQGNQSIYVNRGAGFLGYPGRLGIKPEITYFKLSKT